MKCERIALQLANGSKINKEFGLAKVLAGDGLAETSSSR